MFISLADFVEEKLLVDSSNIVDYVLLENILKKDVYVPRFRLIILNPDETTNNEIPQEDINIDSSNYSENYQNGQRRSLSISIINIDKYYNVSPNGIWIQNKFRLDIGIEWEGQTVWFPRGVYVMNNPNAVHNDSDKIVNLSLSDKFSVLTGASGTLEATYEIPAGEDIEAAIKGILSIEKGDGYPLDITPIYYDKSFVGKTMPYTLTKDAGSNFGEMILEIAHILNAECYYNAIGALCFYPIDETTLDVDKPIINDFDTTEQEISQLTANYDFDNAINIVQVVGDNIEDKVTPSQMLINHDPSSPLCVERIGRRVKYVNDAGINTQQKALDRAKYEMRKASILSTTISFTTIFNPLLFVNNIITLTDEHFDWKRAKAIIQSISFNFNGGSHMSISVSNLDNFGGGVYDDRWYRQ